MKETLNSPPSPYRQQPQGLTKNKSTFENPEPDVNLASMDYVSTETVSVPFMVALIVEECLPRS
jgi:hypothetical protein